MTYQTDILYLGVNMGNCLQNRRFFCRYPEAEQDYYDTFRWLVRLKQELPSLNIAIKHHSGDYKPSKDTKEIDIIANTGICYIDNQLNSYKIANQAQICVSYCSSMILELNGYYNLASYLFNKRHHRIYVNMPCNMPKTIFPLYRRPAYYLDPGYRNRQFCRYIDDINKHDCSNCFEPPYLEIYHPYRLITYEKFKIKMEEVILNVS